MTIINCQCPATTLHHYLYCRAFTGLSWLTSSIMLLLKCCLTQSASNLHPTACIVFVEETRHSLFAMTLQAPLSKQKAIGRESPVWQASKFPLPLLLLTPARQAMKSDAYLVYVVVSLCLKRPNSKSSMLLHCHDSGRSTPPL